MTFKEQKQIAGGLPTPNRIGTKSAGAGAAHPLWVTLDYAFPPAMGWKALHGGVRAAVVRAGELLHQHNITYGMYVKWLGKFDKGYLKRRPLTLFGYKLKKDGTQPLLQEFLDFTARLQQVYKTCPSALKVQDAVYAMYPGSYSQGVLKFLYSLDLIVQTLQTRTAGWLIASLAQHQTIESFWHFIGDPEKEVTPVVELDLSAGVQNKQGTKILSDELRIRTGVAAGFINPKLNKYFKTGGKLNAQGLKVITGERPLDNN